MSMREQLQKTLGDAYTLERELEGGGMARVFVARDQQLGRRVVVKTLADDSGVSVSADRFRREIRLAASLQQANIVPVHSAGDVDGVPYYTMPYVEGESLRAHMDKRGALDVREAVNILRDVARALAFAHERGVVHRDIKPENILLSGNTAVVTDFGIAKAIELSHSQAGSTLTQLGTLLGTPAYISPEQAAGDPNIDHLADIYSLGVVAYEMLAGARPFSATSARALLAAHVNEAPVPLAARRKGLPPRLVALVMQCLEKDPARRPASAGELLYALDAAADAVAAAPTPDAKPSIAVLPFANLSPDPADEFFADGLTDEIITDLAGIHTLHVIARTAMMRFKGVPKEPREVARELKVRYVLDGSVRRAGPSLRLTARLVDASDDTTLWSDKLSGVVDDIFDMQERVSRTIVEALKVTLTPREAERLASRQFDDLKAYEAYLQARQAIWTFDADALASALQLLATARARIGENPRLIATEALAHLAFIETGHEDAKPHLDAVAAVADRLAAIDPDSFSRHWVAGMLQWRTGRIREAIASLTHARELEPSNSDVGVYLAYAYLLAGQDARAREVADHLVSVDPLTPLFQVMPGFCETMAGRPEAAVPYYVRFVEVEPNNPVARYFLLGMLAETDDRAATVAAAEELARRFPATVFGAIGDAFVGVASKRLKPADVAVTSEMRAHSARSDAFARTLAVLLARMEAAEGALDALEDSIRLGNAHYPYLARNSRVLEPLRGHPRFRRLLEIVRERWERGGTSAADLAATEPSAATPRMATVAVLPLANLGGAAEDEYFADGMTEDIIAQLSQIGALRVIARTSVMQYRNSAKRAKDIAADLGATHVVEGSVRRAGSRVRIVAKLVDASTDAHLWSETFDRDLTDVFAIQSEVAAQVASALRTYVTSDERERIERRPTTDLEAYNLFLLGRHHWNQAGHPGAIERAVDCLSRAIERDSAFARAHGMLGVVYCWHGGGYFGMRPRDAGDLIHSHASRALELDPESVEAQFCLAYLGLWHRFDRRAAETHIRKALALNPSNPDAHAIDAFVKAYVGEPVASVEAINRACDFDPASMNTRGHRVLILLWAGRVDDALASLRAVESELGDGFFLSWVRLSVMYALGRTGEILDSLNEWRRRVPITLADINYAIALAAAGEDGRAREVLSTLEARAAQEYIWPVGMAWLLAELGDMTRAFEYLTKALDDRAGGMNNVLCWQAFDRFHGDPRFDAIVKRVGAVAPPGRVVRVRPRATTAAPAPTHRSVAVLPFANLSPDPENAFFTDGVTDDLIAQVAKISELKVISRTSVMRFRDTELPLPQIGQQLGVSAVVEGTVRRAGNRVRIVAQLIDVESDAHLWSETYDRTLDDVFAVQSDVAFNIARALKATLTPVEQRRLTAKPTADAAAYDRYLLARHHSSRRTDESIRKAIEYFEQALARDPRYAAAHAGLADAYLFAGLGYARIPMAEAFAKAKDAVSKALTLDESLAEALVAWGLIALHCDWGLTRSRQALEQAVALNPNHAAGHQFLAWTQFSAGDYIGAVSTQKRALELDPLNVPLIAESGWPYSYAGLHEIAIERYKRAVELDPGFGLGHYNVGIAFAGMGRHTDAVAAYERATALMGPTPWIMGSLAITLVALDERAKAEKLLLEIHALARTGVATWLATAMAADALGEVDEALAALEHGYEAHEPFTWCVALEGWLPFANSRNHARFQALMRKMGITPHDVLRQRELLLQARASG